MANRLSEFYQLYENIIHSTSSDREKDIALAGLLTELERTYHIPLLQKPEWEAKNKAVIALYRIISESRSTL